MLIKPVSINNSLIHGYSNRLDSLQAAVLMVKIQYLDKWNQLRRKRAHLLNELLANTKVTVPKEKDYGTHVYHLYVIQVDERDALSQFLGGQGINSGVHYKIPIHLQDAYAYLGKKAGVLTPEFKIVEQRINGQNQGVFFQYVLPLRIMQILCVHKDHNNTLTLNGLGEVISHSSFRFLLPTYFQSMFFPHLFSYVYFLFF